MRTEDALIAARWLGGRGGERKPVRLIAVGDATVPALHAAALEPSLFESVELRDGLESWAQIVHAKTSEGSLIHVVHGALTTYDLPDLRRVLGEKLK
jgi:hypothetical protein